MLQLTDTEGDPVVVNLDRVVLTAREHADEGGRTLIHLDGALGVVVVLEPIDQVCGLLEMAAESDCVSLALIRSDQSKAARDRLAEAGGGS